MTALRNAILVLAVLTGTVALAACSGGDDLPVPSDPVLAEGQQVFKSKCASCHGTKGDGGLGPRLAGVVAGRYTLEQHTGIIANGRAGMPAFGSLLTPEQITAVARYEREGL